MKRRRRPLGSATKTHAEAADQQIDSIRYSNELVKEHLDHDNCRLALGALFMGAKHIGDFRTHNSSLPKDQREDRREEFNTVDKGWYNSVDAYVAKCQRETARGAVIHDEDDDPGVRRFRRVEMDGPARRRKR
jgi:hypothetical protein